jgi:hypothetical protein
MQMRGARASVDTSPGRAGASVKHKTNARKKAVSAEPKAYELVRKICMTYAETSEKNSWGHPNFRAGEASAR